MKIRILFVSLFLFLFSDQIYPGTSVVVGKDASENGSVLFGHNEDDGGLRVVNVWRVNRKQNAPDDSVQLTSGLKLSQVRETWAYFWFQMNGLKYSDVYMNEWAVTVASDGCPSRLDSSITQGKIGFMLRRLIAERAQTAKEGVRIAGALLDSLGYDDYGRTLVICDPNEAWLISMPGGKYWTARRVPDKAVVVLPDQFIFNEIDFKNDKDWFFSKADIRQLAIDQGWFNPDQNEKFQFAKIFSKSYQNDMRQWRGQQLLTGKQDSVINPPTDGFPFAVYPKKKVSLTDMMTLLRDHFEGSQYELIKSEHPDQYRSDPCCGEIKPICQLNPNRTKFRSICTATTQYSMIAQLRNWLPWPAAGVLWVSFGRPDCHPYLPWYAAADSIPSVYHNLPEVREPYEAFAVHFNPVPGTFDYDPRSAYWIQNELENIIDMDYAGSMPRVQKVRNMIEQKLVDFQSEFDSSMLRLWKKDPDDAYHYCGVLLESATEETMEKSIQMIKILKKMNYR